jgi:hypothetical protein
MQALVYFEAITPVPVSTFFYQSARVGYGLAKLNGDGGGEGNEKRISTYDSALRMFCVMTSLSPKKKPMRTMVNTISIRDPSPGVFSSASFCASRDLSYGSDVVC